MNTEIGVVNGQIADVNSEITSVYSDFAVLNGAIGGRERDHE